MKNKYKNREILNYVYLDSLSNELSKENRSNVDKIFFINYVLRAIAATEYGAKCDFYQEISRNLTEQKAMEYVIEFLVKKEIPELQSIMFDYRAGIVSALRPHLTKVKEVILDYTKKVLVLMQEELAPIESQKYNLITFVKQYCFILNTLRDISHIPGLKTIDKYALDDLALIVNRINVFYDDIRQAITRNELSIEDGRALFLFFIDNSDLMDKCLGEIRLFVLRCSLYDYVVVKENKIASNIMDPAVIGSDNCQHDNCNYCQ